MKLSIRQLSIFCACFAVDTLTKYRAIIVMGSAVLNRGASFSIAADLPYGGWILSVASVAAIALIAFFLPRARRSAGLAIMAAGSTSNLIDRAIYGAVIDWMPVFGLTINIADILIALGALLTLISVARAKDLPEAPNDQKKDLCDGVGMMGAIGAFVAALLCVCALLEPRFVLGTQYALFDAFMRAMADGDPSDMIALVDIDERSIEEIGQWPWPRYEIARLVDSIAGSGALSIGADIVFSERDSASPSVWAEKIRDSLGISHDISDIPAELTNFDDILARSFARSSVTIGCELSDDPTYVGRAAPRTIRIREIKDDGATRAAEWLPRWEGIIPPISDLAQAANVGAINDEQSFDGLFRADPLIVCYEDTLIPSLYLSTIASALGAREIVVRVAADGIVSVTVGDKEIFVDRNGYMLLTYREKDREAPRWSASDVISGKVDRSAFDGKIVFVAASAASMVDFRPTPFDPYGTRLDIIARAADTILSERIVVSPRNKRLVNVMQIIFVSLFCVGVIARFKPSIAIAMIAAFFAAFCCVSWLSTRYGVIATPFFATVTLLMQSAQAFGVRYHHIRKAQDLLQSAFSNYVSPEVVSRIVSERGVDRLAGETRDLTVLFTDITGFTTMTEKMTPQDVAAMLDAYFTPMTRIVRRTGGTIDKFIGDAMMAFWNAPLSVEGHRLLAVDAFMMMKSSMEEINDEMNKKYGVTVSFHAGLHAGPAHVGNMGTREMISYTAIGDTVNTTSRLASLCHAYGVDLAMSETVARECADTYRLIPLDIVKPRGRSKAITIYTAKTFEEAAPIEDELARWDEAFAAFARGDLDAARMIARELAARSPENILYRKFEAR